jgi:hypothetical protein
MQKPEFTPGKPLYIFLKELKAYVIKQTEPKYDLILEFINKAVNLKLNSLLDFKYIDVEKINAKVFRKVLNEYKDKLEEELNIELQLDDDDEEEVNIVNIISTCVKSINYTVYRKRIVLEKKNRNSDSSEERIKKKKLFLSIRQA